MPCKQTSLSVGALLGNLEEVRLPVLLREMNSISGFLSWTPEVIKIFSLSEALASLGHVYLSSFFLDPEDIRKVSTGAIWNFVKGTGLL
jgi:hypothetical protein